EKQISGKSQYVDTTAMEKNIAYPTDTDLLDKGRKRLIAGFQKLKDLGRKISIGRTFKDKAKQAILQVVKLGKGRQERIKSAAGQLAGFAREILDKVPSALRKAKKHKNKKKQKRIEEVQEQIRQDAELLRQQGMRLGLVLFR
ncbi:MAG: hypothetical protein K8F91_02310, partial [Candidatus Obscuribacterales bacterium]|nr:hypothetical protein [Candidatus Obscuribacterales bacterium]